MKKFLIFCMLVSVCSLGSIVYAEDLSENLTDTQSAEVVQGVPQDNISQNPEQSSPKKVLKPSDKAKYDNYCSKAETLIEQKKYNQAESLINKALSLSSDLDMAYALKARLLQKKVPNSPEIITYAQKAIDINPDNYIANNTIGNQYFNKRDYDTAVDYYNKAVKIKPDYTHSLHNLSLAYYNMGNHVEAEKAISSEIKYTNKNSKDLTEIYSYRANIYNALNQYDKAIKDCNVALTYDKTNYYATAVLARAYASKGNYNDAIKYVNKAVKLAENKNDPEVYLSRIYIYHSMNYDYNMVAQDFKKAEELAGKNSNQLYRVLMYLNLYNKDKEVARLSQKIMAIDPNNKNAIMFYVGALIDNGNYEQAQEVIKKINPQELNNNSEKASYANNSALIKSGIAGLSDKELLKQAISEFKESYELDNKLKNAYYLVGNCYFILGDYKNAYNNYNTYLENNYKTTNSYEFKGIYKYLLLRELTSYENFEVKNGKKNQIWASPDWVYANANLKDIDWDNISESLNNDLAGRINYSNGVSRIDDKNYILSTINMLKSRKGNIAKVYNLHINNDSYGNTSRVFVYPFLDASDRRADFISDEDYNLLLANQYFLLLRNSVGSYPQVYSINQTDLNNFFGSLNNISKNTAINLINDIASYGIGGWNFFDSETISKEFYTQMIEYLSTNGLTNFSPKTKRNMKDAHISLGDYYLDQDNIDMAIDEYNNAVYYGASKFEVNEFIGNHYYNSDNYFKANEYYTKALAVKANADVYLSRGQARTNLRDYDGAVADFTKAIGYNKNLAEAYWERGQVLFDQKKYAIALNDYIKYSSMNKDSSAAPYNAGICLYNTGKKQAAIPYIEKAKNVAQRVGNQEMYNKCVRLINEIKGYNRGW